jgi:hypothetical protein
MKYLDFQELFSSTRSKYNFFPMNPSPPFNKWEKISGFPDEPNSKKKLGSRGLSI